MKSSPLNELNADDLKRKSIKLGKIKDQMNPEHKDYRPAAQKKLAEKLHKTQYQIDTGKRGRPTSLRNEAWLAGPSRKSALNMVGISPLNDMTKQENDTIDYSNMTSEQKTSLANFWDQEVENYGGNITPGNEGYNELVGENAYAVYDRGRFQPDGKGGGSYPYETPRWRTRHGGSDGKPEHIHSNQAFKMYQGKNNIYE